MYRRFLGRFHDEGSLNKERVSTLVAIATKFMCGLK
jgi:hypothetical protein